MKMSLIQMGTATRTLDHLACIDLAVDAETTKMIMYAFTHNKPVLAGLECGEAIIKPAASGDNCLSFAALYDTAISIREFRKMTDLKVKSPEEFPPSLYEAEILLTEITFVPTVCVRFPAGGEVAVREALTALINHPDFREQLVRRFIMQIIESDHAELRTRGCMKVDEIAPPGLTWEFQDDD